jgi:hypothetical protein
LDGGLLIDLKWNERFGLDKSCALFNRQDVMRTAEWADCSSDLWLDGDGGVAAIALEAAGVRAPSLFLCSRFQSFMQIVFANLIYDRLIDLCLGMHIRH